MRFYEKLSIVYTFSQSCVYSVLLTLIQHFGMLLSVIFMGVISGISFLKWYTPLHIPYTLKAKTVLYLR